MPLPVGFRLIVLKIKILFHLKPATILQKKRRPPSYASQAYHSLQSTMRKSAHMMAQLQCRLLLLFLLFRVVVREAIEQICLHLTMLSAKIVIIS